jgi:hypothetical protein
MSEEATVGFERIKRGFSINNDRIVWGPVRHGGGGIPFWFQVPPSYQERIENEDDRADCS